MTNVRMHRGKILLSLAAFAAPGFFSYALIWRSVPKGDFVADTRDPNEVCSELRLSKEMRHCTLVVAKDSRNDAECRDGKSPAGCFACGFVCSGGRRWGGRWVY